MAEFWADLAKVYADEIKDLADAGCRYVQLDDTDFAYMCDPKFRDMAKQIDIDPDKIHDEYSKLINDVVKNKPKDMVIGVHVCRGNHASSWAAEGGYEPVADALFNRYNFDAYFLEYDSDRSGDFQPLRFVPKGKTVVLGLVTSKEAQLEPKDVLKRRIDEAAKFVALDQLCLSPQCGFASTSIGNLLTVEDEKKKLRLCADVAREVWGN
jgi:5-methyltetrahydropteroyltriglutamate--homocysteine methyltransferase